MGLAFFGLTSDLVPEIRAGVFTQIHEIVFHGNGGYSWETVYNMPTWLRRFTFNKLREYYDDKQNASKNEDLATQSKKIKEGKIDVPSHFKGQMNNNKRIAKY